MSYVPARRRPLLIASDDGIAPAIEAAKQLRDRVAAGYLPLVLLGAETSFPFRARPSSIVVAGMPVGCIACVPQLDAMGIASRLASPADLPGCFEGSVIELTDVWLGTLSATELAEVEIAAWGDEALLKNAAEIAKRYGTLFR